MAEKPILFSTLMINAIQDNRKTATRRVIKPQPLDIERDEYLRIPGIWHNKEFRTLHQFKKSGQITWEAIAPCQKGDILYVRETWNMLPSNDRAGIPADYWYRADDKSENPDDRWRPSIYMPREAARLFLAVKNIRVERLQEITEEDAVAEGCQGSRCDHGGMGVYGCTDCYDSGWTEPPQMDFMFLWDSIYSKRGFGWDISPWVWVTEFERLTAHD